MTRGKKIQPLRLPDKDTDDEDDNKSVDLSPFISRWRSNLQRENSGSAQEMVCNLYCSEKHVIIIHKIFR